MGRSMCGHLLSAGYSVTVFNRTQSKAESLVAQGASWADSPREVAAVSDVIFSIVGYPRDVREVVLGEQGCLAGAATGSILIDMTTSEPSLAVEIAEKAKQKQVESIDAPVSGGDVGARQGTLSIMIGGDREAVVQLTPIWDILGNTWVWQGGPGAGQHTKMVNQTLCATNMIGVCEALLYAHQAGLNPQRVLQSVASGAAGSWALSNLAPRILAGDFAPGFFVEHFIKDMGIALAEAERMQLKLPGTGIGSAALSGTSRCGRRKKRNAGTHCGTRKACRTSIGRDSPEKATRLPRSSHLAAALYSRGPLVRRAARNSRFFLTLPRGVEPPRETLLH